MDFVAVLPEELVHKIFDLLAPEDVLSARCASKGWCLRAEDVVWRRARSAGISLDLGLGEPVPRFSRLPIVRAFRGMELMHPSIACSMSRWPRDSLLAPCARAKMVTVVLNDGDMRNLPAHWLCDEQMPRALHVDMFQASPAAVQPLRPWRNIVSLGAPLARLTGAALDLFPNLRVLEVTNVHESFSDLSALRGRWPRLQSLSLSFVKMLLRDWCALPDGLKWLKLNNIRCMPEEPEAAPAENVRRLLCAPRGEFWSVHGGPRKADMLLQILELPLLESLDVQYFQADNVGLRTPALRALTLHGHAPGAYLDVAALAHLREVTLAHLGEIQDLAWLPAGVRVLKLTSVTVPDGAFLRRLTALTELFLDNVVFGRGGMDYGAPFLLPCDALAGLKRLAVVGLDMFGRVGNPHDLGALSKLEQLTLSHVHDLTHLAFLRRLGALVKLTIAQLSDQPTHTHDCGLGSLLAPLPNLRSLKLDVVNVSNLLLHATRLTHVRLSGVVLTAALTLPTCLRVLTVGESALGSLEFLQWLPALRRLSYASRFADGQGLEVVAALPPLRLLSLELKSLDPNMFECLRASERVELTLYTMPERMPRISAPAVWVGTTRDVPLLDLDFLDPERLVSLELADNLRMSEGAPSLAFLQYCTRLEYLCIKFLGATDLGPLAGHPSLRELDLHTHRALDLRPLLTCPRLVAVTLPPFRMENVVGYDDLMAQLQTRI